MHEMQRDVGDRVATNSGHRIATAAGSLTRDGNFSIENGHIVVPACNLRFNESAIELLSNVAAVGPSERTCVGVDDSSAILAPPLLVKDPSHQGRAAFKNDHRLSCKCRA
jgi:predicted Zn-dependent protease